MGTLEQSIINDQLSAINYQQFSYLVV